MARLIIGVLQPFDLRTCAGIVLEALDLLRLRAVGFWLRTLVEDGVCAPPRRVDRFFVVQAAGVEVPQLALTVNFQPHVLVDLSFSVGAVFARTQQVLVRIVHRHLAFAW